MKVISVNLGEARKVEWRGKKVETGIFKIPVHGPIILGSADIEGDAVVDRKHHGGEHKALYAYSADHYPFWKERFPDLDWANGMFGENLTIEGLNECELRIGSIYQIGEAEVQVSEPRQPCFKLGIRFGTQAVLKPFINSTYSGSYFRVLKPGEVKVGDTLEASDVKYRNPTLAEVYRLLYHRDPGSGKLKNLALNCSELSDSTKAGILKTQT